MGWLRRKWVWANENRLFWANVALIAVSGLLIFAWPGPTLAAGPSDLRLRTWGLLLQLIGVVTVWLDLTRTARQFGKGGFVRHTLLWLKRGLFGEGVVMGAIGTATGADVSRGRGRVRQTIQPQAPLPSRVATLEVYVGQIDQELDAAFREIDQRADELDGKIKAERDERGAVGGEIKKSVEEAATGNLATLAFGVVWLACGILLSTLASEIVKIAAGQWCDVWRAL